MSTCYRCGSETTAAPGALFSGIRTSFRPQESKFLTMETGDVMTKATMCRGCGVIEIFGDVNKLRRLIERAGTADRALRKKPPAGLSSQMKP